MTSAARSTEPGPGLVVKPVGEVRPQVRAEVSGVIRSVVAMSIGGAPACSYTLADGTGSLDLVFLGRIRVAGLEQGRHCRAEGMVAIRRGRNVMWNPRYWIQPEDQGSLVLVVDDDSALHRAGPRDDSHADCRAGRPGCRRPAQAVRHRRAAGQDPDIGQQPVSQPAAGQRRRAR